MSGKILVLEVLAEMLSANQNAGFFKLEFLLNDLRYKVHFLHVVRHPQKLHFGHVSFTVCGLVLV